METMADRDEVGEKRAAVRQRIKEWAEWIETDEAKAIVQRQYDQIMAAFEQWRARK
jgi:hypothetical protein